ncbi:zinc ribbon domain-containing protein [Candidatus Bathyarchaeota archaeon]|nr:zinc ribbon domain-containing protein [Candidatus Bathyarchaeota archaeon]
MVYCPECGTKNKDDAETCSSCQASLGAVTPRRHPSRNGCFRPRKNHRSEDECFGLPNGGAIAGIIFGLIIVIIGLAILSESLIWDYLWALIIVILGISIIAGALYGIRRVY